MVSGVNAGCGGSGSTSSGNVATKHSKSSPLAARRHTDCAERKLSRATESEQSRELEISVRCRRATSSSGEVISRRDAVRPGA